MPNGRVIGTAALGAVPVLIAQLVIAFISLAFKQKVGQKLLRLALLLPWISFMCLCQNSRLQCTLIVSGNTLQELQVASANLSHVHITRLSKTYGEPQKYSGPDIDVIAKLKLVLKAVRLLYGQVDLAHRHSVLHYFFAPCAEGTPQECGVSQLPTQGIRWADR